MYIYIIMYFQSTKPGYRILGTQKIWHFQIENLTPKSQTDMAHLRRIKWSKLTKGGRHFHLKLNKSEGGFVIKRILLFLGALIDFTFA